MVDIEVKTYTTVIRAHPNAGRMQLARVGDYRNVVTKGKFPEQRQQRVTASLF